MGSVLCPRCRSAMVASEISDGWKCLDCRGTFVPAQHVQQANLEALSADSLPSAGDAALNCPICQEPMQTLSLRRWELDRCPTCLGVWLDANEDVDVDEPASLAGLAGRYLLYTMTVPERVVRSSVGIAAGTVRETAGFLIPQAFQSAKTYELVVTNSLGFLAEGIGGVERKSGSETDNEEFLARKAVGNFVDFAGLATLHVSPVWFMAIVSDLAYGSKAYVQELAAELQSKGLINDTSSIHHVDDVLKAIQDASGEAASLFDTPPLSVDQLKATLDSTRNALTSADYRRVLPEEELQQYWQEMRELSAKEGQSLLGISGAVTMQTLNKVSTVSAGALTGVQVVGGLFSRHVVGHYQSSLTGIRERGFYTSLKEVSGPYVAAVWNNFHHGQETWTEEILTGRAVSKALNSFKSWFSKDETHEADGADEANNSE